MFVKKQDGERRMNILDRWFDNYLPFKLERGSKGGEHLEQVTPNVIGELNR